MLKKSGKENLKKKGKEKHFFKPTKQAASGDAHQRTLPHALVPFSLFARERANKPTTTIASVLFCCVCVSVNHLLPLFLILAFNRDSTALSDFFVSFFFVFFFFFFCVYFGRATSRSFSLSPFATIVSYGCLFSCLLACSLLLLAVYKSPSLESIE